MTCQEAAQKFLLYRQYRAGSPATTINTYRGILRRFIAAIGNKSIDTLTIEDIEQYADKLAMSGYKIRTYGNNMATIRSFVKFLYLRDLTDIKPEKVDVPCQRWPQANYLTEDEQRQFIAHCRGLRDTTLMMCLLRSGLRVSEVVNMNIGDVDGRTLTVKCGKGGKPRPVFITKEVQRLLNRYVAKERGLHPGPLFPNPYGTQLSRQIVTRKVTAIAERAGIDKHVSAHTLRHSFATTMIMHGCEIEKLSRIMGHSRIQTTMIYLHFVDGQLGKHYDTVLGDDLLVAPKQLCLT